MIDFGALRRIGRDVRKGFTPTLDVKLREKEIHLLSLLYAHPELPFVFYSERLGLERSSFSYVVDTMELKGLIKRENSDNDKRTKIIILTDLGKIITEEIENQFQQYLKDLLKVLTEEEYEQVDQAVELIKKIMDKVY